MQTGSSETHIGWKSGKPLMFLYGRHKLDFVERDECRPVLLRLSLAGNLEKSLKCTYGTEWRERGYELEDFKKAGTERDAKSNLRQALVDWLRIKIFFL
jgi:hypothetical protein